MRKLLILFCSMFIFSWALASSGSNSKIFLIKTNSTKDGKDGACCVTTTRTASVSATDCEGVRFTVTQSASGTGCNADGDCVAAYNTAVSNATTSAIVLAQIAATLITANCQ